MPLTCLPSSRSSEGNQGTELKTEPLSIMAKPPEESESLRLKRPAREFLPWQANTRARLGGQAPTHTVELAIAKGRNQATAQRNLVPFLLASPGSTSCRYVGRARQGLSPPKPARERSTGSRATATVEPGCPSRFHLLSRLRSERTASAIRCRPARPHRRRSTSRRSDRRPPLRFQGAQVMHRPSMPSTTAKAVPLSSSSSPAADETADNGFTMAFALQSPGRCALWRHPW